MSYFGLGGVLILLTGLLIVLLASLTYHRQESRTETRNWLLQELVNRGFPLKTAKYLTAISSFETGFWTSALCKRYNNYFGFRQATIRETTATGTALDHAMYNSRSDSVQDLILYWQYHSLPLDFGSLQELIGTLKQLRYFTIDYDTYYNRTLRHYEILFKS